MILRTRVNSSELFAPSLRENGRGSLLLIRNDRQKRRDPGAPYGSVTHHPRHAEMIQPMTSSATRRAAYQLGGCDSRRRWRRDQRRGKRVNGRAERADPAPSSTVEVATTDRTGRASPAPAGVNGSDSSAMQIVPPAANSAIRIIIHSRLQLGGDVLDPGTALAG